MSGSYGSKEMFKTKGIEKGWTTITTHLFVITAIEVLIEFTQYRFMARREILNWGQTKDVNGLGT